MASKTPSAEDQGALNVRNLSTELHTVSKWYQLGIKLGLEPSQLHQIEQEVPTDIDRRKIEVVNLWLLSTPGASWQHMVTALIELGEVTTAERIQLKYVKGGGADSHHEEPSKAAAFALENRRAINAKFANFLGKVCKRMLENGVNVDEFRLFVVAFFPPGDCIPLPPTNVTEVFEAITHNGLWDSLHYSPLVRIVRNFGASDPEMKDWIQDYMKDVKAYTIVASIEDCIDSDLDTCTRQFRVDSAKYDPRYNCPVEWKTEFVDHSLQHLTDVWKMFSARYLVPDSPPTALLDRVRKGCVSMTWLLPSYLIPQLVKRVKVDTTFFQKHRILKVIVGGDVVYEEKVAKKTTESAKERLQKLRDDGKRYFAKGKYEHALKLYEEGIKICEEYKFEMELATLNGNMAAIYLKLGNFGTALDYSNKCLKLNPEYSKGYFRRAEACKNLALMTDLDSDQRKDYCQSATDAYFKAFEFMSECTDATIGDTIYRAILLAFDCGHTVKLNLTQRDLDDEVYVRLFEVMMKSKKNKAIHFKFLIDETAHKTLPKFQCSSVLEKEDIDSEILQALLNVGAYLVPKDLEKVIDTFPDSQAVTNIIGTITDACHTEEINFDSLCKRSLDAKKLQFAAHFISCGARPQVADVESSFADWKDVNEVQFLCVYNATSSKSDKTQLLEKVITSDHFKVAERALDSTNKPLDVDKFDLTRYIESTSITTELVQKLLKKGVDPNKRKPLDAVFGLEDYIPRKLPLINVLVEEGAEIDTCTFFKMVELALREEGDPEVKTLTLQVVCDHYNFPEDGKVMNNHGQTPWHLAMNAKRKLSLRICEILSKYHIDPTLTDWYGKRADDKVPDTDERLEYFRKAEKTFKPPQIEEPIKPKRKRQRVKQKKTKDAEGDHSPATGRPKPSNKRELHDEIPKAENTLGTMPPVVSAVTATADSTVETWTSVTSHLLRIMSENEHYFTSPSGSSDVLNKVSSQNVNQGDQETDIDDESGSGSSHSFTKPAVSHPDQEKGNHLMQDTNKEVPKGGSAAEPTVSYPDQDTNKEVPNQGSNISTEPNLTNTEEVPKFDGLVWEVECTDDVLKFLGSKKTPYYLQKLAIQKIYRIANGEFPGNTELCKSVSQKKGLELYEAKLTKSDRILWQIAKHYSKRCTDKVKSNSQSGPAVYSEVIRIWRIVRNHDRIHHGVQQIEMCVKQIEKARDWETSVPKDCITPLYERVSSVGSEPNLRYPRTFVDVTCDQHTKDQVKESLVPPATPEGNLLKLYRFSSAIAHSILEHSYDNIHRKYPFKEWREEHDIIQMADSESILLVGRSGTGKTTCCLYRMMNQFHHWSGDVASQILLPRAQLTPKTDTLSDLEAQECHSSPSASNLTANSEANFDAQLSKGTKQDFQTCSSSEFEYLHQVFVSKNYVLCDEMEKQFYEMASEGEHGEIHTVFNEKLPQNISDIDDGTYPLFLTARKFFLLLDNSISGDPFFLREKDGSLKVKILSYDYDYGNPDAHVDLQLTDSESEDDYQDEFGQHWETWREVTASYFVDHIWPDISGSDTELDIDPLLVWMEINSFIKGSREALEKECGYLDQKEYEELGRKMAPHFSNSRNEIYKLFQKYKQFLRHHRYSKPRIFDECDFIHQLYHRLDENVPWSIHVLYVDEVQDFTQAELSLLLSCCRCPNGHFMTGDTAQCIMRGISFRFKDLKTIFYNAKVSSQKLNPQVQVTDPKLKNLTVNFRSDSGVLRLAESVVDILQRFFPTSFDSDLPHDKAMFDKPESLPVLLQLSGDNINDLALIMYGNRREASNIQFGAHQAVIVQSEEARQEANTILSGNILTVYEAKGLEFDDVLLYNFFKCSTVKDAWRVVTSFLKELPDIPENMSPKLFKTAPHPLKFEETQHKSLCVELKYLYTAITRAKHKLWIYESDEGCNWLPMFDYWHKKGLAKVISVDDIGKLSKGDQEVLFPVAEFKKEDWKKQGDYFSEKRRWELAMKCYQRSGAEERHLEKEANGYFLVQQAEKIHEVKRKDTIRKLYLQATLAFLECDQLNHDERHLKNAAICLMNGKKYKEAAELFERLSEYALAFRGYRRVGDVESCIRVKVQAKDYSGAVRYQMSVKLRVGLVLAAQYVRQGIFEPNQRIERIALSYAKRYAQKKDKEKLLSIIDCIVDVSQRVSLMKQATLFVKAAELLALNKQYHAVFRILSGQGEHKRGIELAEQLKNKEMIIRFVLQAAMAQLATGDSITDSYVLGKLEEFSTHADPPIKAKASLLLGKTLKDSNPTRAVQQFRKAYNIYRSSYPNKVGEVESFYLISKFKKFQCNVSSIQFVTESVEASRAAIEVAKSLRIMTDRPASAIHTVHRAEEFYSFQKVREDYFLPQDQDLWLEKLKSRSTLDEDGMMRLGENDTLSIVAKHLEHYISNWVDHNETLTFKLSSFTFYMQLVEQKHLTHSYRSCPPEQLKQFLDICFVALDLESVCKSETFCRIQTVMNAHQSKTVDVQNVLLRMLSPLNMLYLPLDRNTNFSALRKSDVASQVLKDEISTILGDHLEKVKVDDFLQVWKLNNILGVIDQAASSLRSLLQQRTNDANTYYKLGTTQPYSSSSEKLAIQQYPHGQRYPPPYFSSSAKMAIQQYSHGPRHPPPYSSSSAKMAIQQYPHGPRHPPPYSSSSAKLAIQQYPHGPRHPPPYSSSSAKLAIQQYPHGPSHPPPYAFIYNPRMDKYEHFFFFWIESCKCIRQGNVITAVKMSMDHFICVVVRRRSLRTVSVANLVNILSVYSTALFATLSFSGYPHKQHYTFIVPHTFKYTVEIFDELNCQQSDDLHVLVACAQNVQMAKSFKELQRKAFDLLWRIMEILLGRYREFYHVLRYAVSKKSYIESSEALHCLVLALTLLGNMALAGYHESYITNFRWNIYDALKHIPKHVGECGQVLMEARETLAYCTDAQTIFRVAILKLLASIESRNAGLLKFRVFQQQQLSTVRFDDIPPHRVPQRPLIPLLQKPTPTHSAQHTADTPPNPASPQATQDNPKQIEHTEVEQHFQEEDPEQPQLTPDFNRSTSYPGASAPEEPVTQDDDVFDDEEINILEAAERTEIVPDNKAEEEIKGDESLTDKKCCLMCGKLISTSYEAHCEREDHQQNSQLYESFKKAEEQYNQCVTELQRMLKMCQALEEQRHSLGKITIAITIMLRETGQKIEEIKQKYDWKKGKSEIEEMTGGKMNSLVKQGKAELHMVESRENEDNHVTDKVDVDSEGESDHEEDLHIPIDPVSQKQRKGKKQGTTKSRKKSRKC